MKMRKISHFFARISLMMGFFSPAIQAIQTEYATDETEENFKQGEPNQVIVSSEGYLSLAYQTETLLEKKNEVWVVNALVRDAEGNLYAGTSGQGLIYRLTEGREPAIIYGEDDEEPAHIFSLALDQEGRLLAGTGGKAGTLLRFTQKGKPEVLFEKEGLHYIWSITVGPAGRIYLGTGPEGEVMTLDPQGRNPEVLYDAKEKNILVTALDRDGVLYAGGDTNGLVYRIEPGSKKTTIAYDTGHDEISGLVFDEKGNLYVSTSDAGGTRPGSKLIFSDGDTSRPEKAGGDDGDAKADDDKDADEKKGENDTDDENNDSDDDAAEAASTSKDKDVDNGKEDSQLVPAATSESNTPASNGAGLISSPTLSPAGTNEVFQISPRGFVRSLFKQKVLILSLVYAGDGKLVLGTGNDGELIRLDAATGEAAILHRQEDAKQLSALWRDDDGSLIVGGANIGQIMLVRPDYVTEGYFESRVMDADQVSRWGALQVSAVVPDQAGLLMATRTGNTDDPEKGGWQSWTEPVDARKTQQILSENGRFLQYRFVMKSADGRVTPKVYKVNVAHLTPNLPPKVSNVSVTQNPDEKKKTEGLGRIALGKTMTIKWQAEDENDDELRYEVYLRQTGHKHWIRIAKDLDKTQHQWNSLTAADGRYEFKVRADDGRDNPAAMEHVTGRISRPVIVDNTPPSIQDYTLEQDGRKCTIAMKVVDNLSTIAAIDYLLDSGEQWEMVLPVDGIYDNQTESLRFMVEIEESGSHNITLRAEDSLGNVDFKNIMIEIE